MQALLWLVSQSYITVSEAYLGIGNWYLHPEDESTTVSDRIESEGDRGWYRTRDTTDDGHRQVILRRVAACNWCSGGKVHLFYSRRPSRNRKSVHTLL